VLLLLLDGHGSMLSEVFTPDETKTLLLLEAIVVSRKPSPVILVMFLALIGTIEGRRKEKVC